MTIVALLVSIAFGFCLTACTAQAPNGTVNHHYFGYTVVTFPKTGGNRSSLDAKQVTNFGIAFGPQGSVSIGYTKNKVISLAPDGRVLFEVQTDAQFERAEKLIKELNQIGICVVQSTQPKKVLRPTSSSLTH